LKKFRQIVRWVVGVFFASTILAVIAYRFIPVFITPLMVIRCVQNGSFTIHHRWIPLDEMSPHMPVAVMASEDSRFLLHHGFDFQAIGDAAKHNLRGGKKHGASTISQQTAKNVFLWPGRSWIRKGFEVYFTALIEVFWGKHRIMEVYLNSIEMGPSIYGTAACAEYNFGKKASDLSRGECAPHSRTHAASPRNIPVRICGSANGRLWPTCALFRLFRKRVKIMTRRRQ
jgi:monofunctional biosynthetic peptidoglycan transglycosylase